MTKQVVMKIRNEAKQKGSACVLRWWTFMATDISALLMFGDSFHAIERGQVSKKTLGLFFSGILTDL